MSDAQLELSNTLRTALEEEVSRIDATGLPPEEVTMLAFIKLRKERPDVFNPMVQGDQVAWLMSEETP